jgi:hypothetical protein
MKWIDKQKQDLLSRKNKVLLGIEIFLLVVILVFQVVMLKIFLGS